MHEQNAGQFREEHSAFLGVRLLVAGGKRAISKQAARLIVVQPPAGAVRSTLWESLRTGVLTRVRTKGKERRCVYTSNPHQNLISRDISERCSC